jgi:oligosaccharide repeat unit polymerase
MVPVTVPLAVGLLASTTFFWALWRRGHGGVPWFEIGSVYVTVVTLYMAFPLIGYVTLGGTYTPFNDDRLINLAPGPQEVGRVAWLYVCHLLGFVLAYLAVRGRLPKIRPRPRPPSVHTVVAIIVVYLLIEGFVIALGLSYNMAANSYLESYLVAKRLPLVLAQLLNHLEGMKYPLSLAILTVLFLSYRTSRPLIVLWFGLTTSLALVRMGSRTEVVLLAISATAMYHVLVRPLSLKFIVGASATGLVGFLVFGALRSGHIIANPFASASEFESLFGNAVHLARIGRTIDHVPGVLYFTDLAALVPQQLVPFYKIDPATWYVTRFFPVYAAEGGGLAFGTVAEAILTGGAISALARGAVLGLCFAMIHRACLHRSGSFWVFVFYIWITTLCYQPFRNTTLSLAVLIGYRFLPAVVAVTLLAAFFAAVAHGRSPIASKATAVVAS